MILWMYENTKADEVSFAKNMEQALPLVNKKDDI
jgi:hypothetical protein